MDSKNGLIFNRFGEEILNENIVVSNGLNENSVNNIVDKKIQLLNEELKQKHAEITSTIKDQLGEEIKAGDTALNENIVNNIVDKKIQLINEEFKQKQVTIMSTIKDQLGEEVNEIKKYFSMEKNYLGVKNRRIVSAKPGLDKNDCVTKIQLDGVTTLYSALEKRVSSLESKNKLRKSTSSSSIPETIARENRSTDVSGVNWSSSHRFSMPPKN